jgi:hypothetical protein
MSLMYLRSYYVGGDTKAVREGEMSAWIPF